jgi:hypothetical protein
MTEFEPTMPANSPSRRPWIAWTSAFVVAGLLLAAGAAGAVTEKAREHDATRAEAKARVVEHRARVDAAAASRSLAEARTSGDNATRALATPLATVEGLVQLSDQGLTASRDAQRLGLDPSDGAVDAYNEAVTRANVVADQFNGAVDRLSDQLAALAGVSVVSV